MKKLFSFASSHAANTAGIATYFGIKYRKSLPILSIITLLISWSRIYLGYHFPFDVFIGVLIGIYSGIFITLAERIIQQKLSWMKIKSFLLIRKRQRR